MRRAVTRQYLPAIRQGTGQTVRAGNGDEPVIAVQGLPDQEHDGVRARWLLCRSAGCQRQERQMFAARVQKGRTRLARRASQVAAGTFTRTEVIHRKVIHAVGRTHSGPRNHLSTPHLPMTSKWYSLPTCRSDDQLRLAASSRLLHDHSSNFASA
jgi:hypothetical protein